MEHLSVFSYRKWETHNHQHFYHMTATMLLVWPTTHPKQIQSRAIYMHFNWVIERVHQKPMPYFVGSGDTNLDNYFKNTIRGTMTATCAQFFS